MQRGGVPAAVHILVHLLGDLLRMAEVGGCHSNPGVSVNLVRASSNPVAIKKYYTFLMTFPYSLHHHHDIVYFDGGQGAVVAVRDNQDINKVQRT